MNGVLRIARLKIALQRAFPGRAILIFTWNASISQKKGISTAVAAETMHIPSKILSINSKTFRQLIRAPLAFKLAFFIYRLQARAVCGSEEPPFLDKPFGGKDTIPLLKIYPHTGPPCMSPFNIVELIIHRKYQMMGRDSKVD